MGQESKITLSIIELVDEYQTRYGLAFDDFVQYRKFCARKIRRIRKRKSVNFVQTDGKHFVARDLYAEATEGVTNGEEDDKTYLVVTKEHIELLVFETERAWSYAMELKQKVESNSETNGVTQKHKQRKFSKASSWGRELVKTCKEFCCPKTVTQATAFSLYIDAFFYLESSDLENAALSFAELLPIYKNLVSIVPSSILAPKQERVEYFLTYCKRYLVKEGKDTDKLLSQVDGKNIDQPDSVEDTVITVFGISLEIPKQDIKAEIEKFVKKYEAYEESLNQLKTLKEEDFIELYSLIDSITANVRVILRENTNDSLATFEQLLVTKKAELIAHKSLILLREKMEVFESEKLTNLFKLCERTQVAFEQLNSADTMLQNQITEIYLYKCFVLGLMHAEATEVDSEKKACRLFSEVASSKVNFPLRSQLKERCLQQLSKILLTPQDDSSSMELKPSQISTVPSPLPAKPFVFDLVLEKFNPELLVEVSPDKSPQDNTPIREESEKGQGKWFGGWFNKG